MGLLTSLPDNNAATQCGLVHTNNLPNFLKSGVFYYLFTT
jgi:hypothetical protein